MKPIKHTIQAVLISLVGMWCAHHAQAAYDYTILGDGLVGGFNVTLDGSSHNGILVGGIHLTGNYPGYADFRSVCVDLNGSIYIGNTYKFDVVPFAGQMGLNPTWGTPPPDANTAFQAINNAAHLYATANPATATEWASLQLAVWKAIYDTDSSGKITGSRFTVGLDPTGSAWTDAMNLINGLNLNGRPTDYVGYLLSPEDKYAQELLIRTVPVGESIPVPEPGTILGGILLLIPMGFSAMRFVRKQRRA